MNCVYTYYPIISWFANFILFLLPFGRPFPRFPKGKGSVPAYILVLWIKSFALFLLPLGLPLPLLLTPLTLSLSSIGGASLSCSASLSIVFLFFEPLGLPLPLCSGLLLLDDSSLYCLMRCYSDLYFYPLWSSSSLPSLMMLELSSFSSDSSSSYYYYYRSNSSSCSVIFLNYESGRMTLLLSSWHLISSLVRCETWVILIFFLISKTTCCWFLLTYCRYLAVYGQYYLLYFESCWQGVIVWSHHLRFWRSRRFCFSKGVDSCSTSNFIIYF